MEATPEIAIELYEKLCKLFAEENIGFVVNSDLNTAAFDIKSRVLHLPFWEFSHTALYHFVIAHEIGHAMYSPVHEIWENIELKGIANIVEDYRIDVKIKTKFPGIISDYKSGISWLVKKNFFGTEEQIQSKLNFVSYQTFLDRLVLYLKVKANNREYTDIPFTTTEKKLVNKVILASSFDDVVSVSHEILSYLKLEKQKDTTSPQSNSGSMSKSQGTMQQSTDQPQQNAGSEDAGAETGESNSDADQSTDENVELYESSIQNNLNESISNSTNKNENIRIVSNVKCDIVELNQIYTKRTISAFSM